MNVSKKNLLLSKFALVLVCLGLGAAAQAADLTRAVKVVEGAETHVYVGTQFGQTLYTFDLDKNGVSACYQGCAEKWPPLLVSDAESRTLVAPLAAILRTSGFHQVTYKGRPVYTYYLDHAEGDDKGDGVGGVWHDIDFPNP